MTYEMFRVAPIWWKSGRGERQMKRAGLILGVVFVMALAVVVGNRMSVDAMAVVEGVACGVLASIPTRVLLIWALGRKAGAGGYGDRSGHYPPIVVVNPGQSFGGRGMAHLQCIQMGTIFRRLPALATSRWWAMLRQHPMWPSTPGPDSTERACRGGSQQSASGALAIPPVGGWGHRLTRPVAP